MSRLLRAPRKNKNMHIWQYGQMVTMPDLGFDGVSLSLAEFMSIFFCFSTFFFNFFFGIMYVAQTPHEHSTGCVLQPAGYNAIHACCPPAEQEATPHACGSFSALYYCGLLVAFIIGPCDLQACGSLLLCDTCMLPQVRRHRYRCSEYDIVCA